MKVEKLLELIGDIDDSFVAEATHGKRNVSKLPWSLMATAACLCLVIASVVFLRSMGLLPVAPIPTDPTETTTQSTETTEPVITTPAILQEQLENIQKLFSQEGSWYNLALTSTYDSPKEVGLLYFFYNGFEGVLEPATKEEEAQLKELSGDNNKILLRLPVAKMNEVLTQYFGITVDQMDERSRAFAGMEYLESTDCWYYYGATGVTISVGRFTAWSATVSPLGVVEVHYSAGSKTAATHILMLQPYGDGYRILSNQPIA